MRRKTILLILILGMLAASTLHARQEQAEGKKQSAIEQLQAITLLSSEGDSLNIGEEIGKNPFTLIVMYRGVW